MPTARSLYVHNALLPYIDFMQGQSDRVTGNGLGVTKVVAIADALLNLPDYLKRENPPHPELGRFKDARSYRESLWKENPDYEIVCDIANSQKHRFVTRDDRKLDDIGEVRETYALCRYKDSAGDYYRTLKAVIVHSNDGKKYNATRILTSAMKLWAKELFRLAVAPQTPDRMFQHSEFISRKDTRYIKPLRLLGIVGEPLRFDPILLEYSEREGVLIHVQPGTGFDGKAHFEFEGRLNPFDA